MNTQSAYVHRSFDASIIPLPAGKLVCVGRNYADHIKELNNATPSEPLLFMKPNTSLCRMDEPIALPKGQGECHNELEVAVLIKQTLSKADVNTAHQGIWGLGLGLDLTLRDLQNQLKAKGLPWERAKSFDNACPVSAFLPIEQFANIQSVDFSLQINSQLRQKGNTSLMLYDIDSLLSEISQTFTLLPGDIVMTGTPKGVGPLVSGDKLHCRLNDALSITTSVM